MPINTNRTRDLETQSSEVFLLTANSSPGPYNKGSSPIEGLVEIENHRPPATMIRCDSSQEYTKPIDSGPEGKHKVSLSASNKRSATENPYSSRNSAPSDEMPPKKKFRSVPRNAPRDIETKGRFSFRKGVRIWDYKVLQTAPGSLTSPPQSLQSQCRDGFDEDETSLGYSQPMGRDRENAANVLYLKPLALAIHIGEGANEDEMTVSQPADKFCN